MVISCSTRPRPGASQRVKWAIGNGFRGVSFPAMHRYAMHDECALAVLESLRRSAGNRGVRALWSTDVGIRAKVGLPSRFDMRFSNPIDLHSIALRLPNLNFVIPHFGAGYFREALMVADLCRMCTSIHRVRTAAVKYQAPAMEVRDAFSKIARSFGSTTTSIRNGFLVFPARLAPRRPSTPR